MQKYELASYFTWQKKKSSWHACISMDGVRLSGKDEQCTYSYLIVNSWDKIRIT
jgi:hypothetical protein